MNKMRNIIVGFALIGLAMACTRKDVVVSNTDELKAALSGAKPGDDILVKAGDYTGPFEVTVDGESDCPITITGTGTALKPAKFTAPSNVALTVKADFWEISLINFHTSKQGIAFEGASHNIVKSCSFTKLDNEIATIYGNSSGNYFTESYACVCGAGVVIGKDDSDPCESNVVSGCHFDYNIKKTHLVVNAGSKRTSIYENRFMATNTDDADAFVEINADGTELYQVHLDNYFGSHSTIEHGVIINSNDNTFRQNMVDLYSSGYGFYVKSGSGNVVCKSNAVNGGTPSNIGIDGSC